MRDSRSECGLVRAEMQASESEGCSVTGTVTRLHKRGERDETATRGRNAVVWKRGGVIAI